MSEYVSLISENLISLQMIQLIEIFTDYSNYDPEEIQSENFNQHLEFVIRFFGNNRNVRLHIVSILNHFPKIVSHLKIKLK